MPSRRYTLRLPRALDDAVQAHLHATNTPFADLMREALSAYLGDTPRTVPLTSADTPPTLHALTSADSTNTLRILQDQLAALTSRVEILEQRLTPRRQRADRSADRAPTGRADTPPTEADSPPAYDTARYILGRLCPRGHEYQQSGQTLRLILGRKCRQCEIEGQRERRRVTRERLTPGPG